MASAETKSLISKLGIRIVSKSGNSSVPLSSNGLLRSGDVELGEDVLVSGFPYGEIFSNTVKVTKGIVSAIRGMGDDSGQFQMDAAVQAGNSGGPIYDENGNIVGVVISQLNRLKVAKVQEVSATAKVANIVSKATANAVAAKSNLAQANQNLKQASANLSQAATAARSTDATTGTPTDTAAKPTDTSRLNC